MIDFKGKDVLVTGGGAGIGRATLEAFVKAGARVAIIEIDPKRAANVRRAHGDAVLVVDGDVTDTKAVAALAQQLEQRFGGLDVLVNNVGDYLQLTKPFERYTDEEIERLYAVNLRQIFGVTRAVIPLLKRRAGASIVSVSSIEGYRGIPMCAVYSAFKTAIGGFTKSLALDLAPSIRVNAIAPETTQTPQVPIRQYIAPEFKDHEPRWNPLGRFGEPEDIASGILFLASPHAAWITGTTLHVDGGALAAAGWYRDPKGMWTILPVVSGNGLNL